MTAPKSICFILVILSLLSLFTLAIPLKEISSHVKYLDDDNFSKYIDDPHRISFVLVHNHSYVCLACPTVADTFSKTAKDFLGQVSFYAIDIADSYSAKSAERLGLNRTIAEFPQIIKFPADGPSHSPEIRQAVDDARQQGKIPLIGSPISIQRQFNIKTFKQVINDAIQLHSTVRAISSSKKKLLSLSETHNKPKAILFTTKTDIPNVWASLSYQYKDKFDFFLAQKTDRKLVKRFSIDNFPSIAILRRNEINIDTSDDDVEPIIYDGLMKAPAIRAYLALHSQLSDLALSTISESSSSSSLHHDSNNKQISALDQSGLNQYLNALYTSYNDDIPVIYDRSCFKHWCRNNPRGGLCAMYIAPSISIDSIIPRHVYEITYQLEIILGLQQLRLDNSIQFMIFDHLALLDGDDIPSHKRFLSTFNIERQEYPQLVIYNPRKDIYTTLFGSFDTSKINTWIADILGGSIPLHSIHTSSVELEHLIHKTTTKCDILDQKILQYKTDNDNIKQKAMNDERNNSNNNKNNNSVPIIDPNTGENILPEDRWLKPYRPNGKRGEVRQLTDDIWNNIILRRSITLLIQFLDRPDNYTYQQSSENKTDIELFIEVGQSLNSMIETFWVSCHDDNSKYVRSIFGAEECVGQIYLLPGRASLTQEWRDYKIVENELLKNKVLYTIDNTDVKNNGNITFTTSRLTKFALSILDDVKPHILDKSPESFQNWLLTNINIPRVLIFTNKLDSILAKALLIEFNGVADVALVPPDHDSLKHQFQIDTLPAIRIVRPVLSPRQNADGQEMKLSLELIPIDKTRFYYNGIASILDHMITHRTIGRSGTVYHPIKQEKDMDPVDILRQQAKSNMAKNKDEL